MDAAAPNGNHYWQVEIVHIVSIAPSWRPNISSGIFAPAVRVIPRLRSNRHGICEFALFCYSAASSLFLSYRNIFSLPVTARRFFPSCHSGPFFFICHSGLRAGVQVNIDSLATWIPGQARNDSKKTSPEWQRETRKTRRPFDGSGSSQGVTVI